MYVFLLRSLINNSRKNSWNNKRLKMGRFWGFELIFFSNFREIYIVNTHDRDSKWVSSQIAFFSEKNFARFFSVSSFLYYVLFRRKILQGYLSFLLVYCHSQYGTILVLNSILQNYFCFFFLILCVVQPSIKERLRHHSPTHCQTTGATQTFPINYDQHRCSSKYQCLWNYQCLSMYIIIKLQSCSI